MNYDGIIFDLDGTLWDAAENICISWNEVLEKHMNITRRSISCEELGDCMGLTMYDIASKLFPEEDKTVRNALMDEMCIHENEYLYAHGGVLFEGLCETLEYLSKKHKLYIVSNCQDGYIEAFIHAHHMEKYFLDTECWGRTRVSKGESNRILMERNNLVNPIYVGDTAGDAKSAADAGIPFVYAEYGFGRVDQYDYVIRSFSELKNIF